MSEISHNETNRPCRFCRHYVRRDRATAAAAVCLHVDRPRLNRLPEAGCGYWELRFSAKPEWCAWVNEEFVRRMLVDGASS